ncbi:ESX-1 secretion-associated protein [Mycobacterium pseudoshottsii]|uniref:ESX-1 secretion-associated protein n=1 Tax=Mycobacterium pseudoshottsii TaxID=265949 RepID=UPI0021C25B56|nr:ESX-1 secretion-associated protein [Mycobacterium pseudoshottsii]BEH78614.1 hypothetical protein YM3MPS_44170 [Mycobacterium pseudoshottsii]
MNEILTLQPDVISRLSQGHDATVTGLQAATAAPAGISANVATTHRAPALLISRLVSWVDDLWCRAIGAGV